VLVDFGLQARDQMDGAMRAILGNPAGFDVGFIPERARRLQACFHLACRHAVVGDALAVARGLGVPVHVQHVEQALAWARFRGLHAVEIEFEEIAAIGVRCLLQADHAIPAIVDRAEDQGLGRGALDAGGEVDALLRQLGIVTGVGWISLCVCDHRSGSLSSM